MSAKSARAGEAAKVARVGAMVAAGAARADTYPHGTRNRYVVGRCRCDECRAANTAYERARNQARAAGDWNGYVPADRARRHIAKLSRNGIGYKAINAVSDVGRAILVDIISGKRQQIRARTERKILLVNVSCAADRALIDSAPTWRLIDELLDEGYTKQRIATEMGYARPYLQLKRGKTITAKNAAKIERIHRKLTT